MGREGDAARGLAFGGGESPLVVSFLFSVDAGGIGVRFRLILKSQNIEIVGGGVAGLSLAVGLAQRGVRVTLLEAGTYPRHRLCGEFVNGVSDGTLQNLGVLDLFDDARKHRKMAWWLRSERIAQAQLDQTVKALSRWEMDQRMASRFRELGGSLQERARVVCTPQSGRVWAAGRRLQKESEWIGLKAHFLGLQTESDLEMHLGEGGYVGLTPVEGNRVNVCGLFRRRDVMSGKGSERLLGYLAACGLGDLTERLREVVADESSLTGISGVSFGEQGHESNLLSIGDAERMIPPFTGNGMSMAFEAAECALTPLVSYAHAEASWAEVQEQVRSKLRQRFRRRMTLAQGIHNLILKSPARDVLAAAAKPGLVPFSFLNRILT